MVVWLLKVYFFLSQHRLKPTKIAAVNGNRGDVEILLPATSPIPSYVDWSVNGIMKHANSKKFKKQVNISFWDQNDFTIFLTGIM
ncbi:hypothetical protein MKX03_010204 [Papaver bracteatum]|nr:hypothetical protein MKX03_010204 [Papaver bracteatum]